MKRGLITWDKTELPPEVFERRMGSVRSELAKRRLPALVVYSDLWRSNHARFFSNYMPYFNRALLILPLEHPPTLLCGLSPRVYTWIRSVTTIEDVRPAGNFARPLSQIAAERGWTKIGILDAKQLPWDMNQAIRGGPMEIVNVDAAAVYQPGRDETELAMRRKAAATTRLGLDEELPRGVGEVDHHFVGRLEGRFRRAGAEDLVILLTHGAGPPALPSGARLPEHYSISVAFEYRGHWVRVSRPQASSAVLSQCRDEFQQKLGQGWLRENLAGSYPYECVDTDSILSFHIELKVDGKRLFYGDTCRFNGSDWEIL